MIKVGDWVISTSWINSEPRQIIKIELATSSDEEDYVFFSDSCCVELKYIEKLIPEPGVWVIPDTGVDKNMFIVMKYNGMSLIVNRCQPFIGQLPSNLKD